MAHTVNILWDALAITGFVSAVFHLARFVRAWWNDPARVYRRRSSALRMGKWLPR